MPKDYQCSSCECTISIGSYHGFDGEYVTAVYCKNCGAQYYVQQSTVQFFDGLRGGHQREEHPQYQVRGPSTIQTIDVALHEPSPQITCDICREEGVFGAAGYITEDAPEGLGEDCYAFDYPETKQTGICPACKKNSMEYVGEWTT